MKFNPLSLRALLIASTAILVPAFAFAQTETETETETDVTPTEAETEAAVTESSPAETTPAPSGEEDIQVVEVVVLGRYIPEVLRDTSEVAAFLSAEDLERQGDSDAASSLARVTGLNHARGLCFDLAGLCEP